MSSPCHYSRSASGSIGSAYFKELAESLRFKNLEVLSRGARYADQDIRTSIALSYDNLASPEERYLISFYVEYTDKYRDDFAALATSHDNVLQAAEWAKTNNAWEAVYNIWEASRDWLDSTGDWSNGYSLLECAVQANRILKNREVELAETLYARSESLELTGKIEEALKDAKEALALGYAVGDRKTIAMGLVRVGSLYGDYLGRPEQALNNFKEAWGICQHFLEWDESAYIAYKLSGSYQSHGDYTTARILLESSIDICKRLPPHYAVASLGNLFIELGQYEQARQHLEKSLTLKLGDQFATANSMVCLASLELRLGKVKRAIHLTKNALEIYNNLGATSRSFSALRMIGDIYRQYQKYTKAAAWYEEARAVGQRTDLARELASTLSNLGTAYYELGRYNEALTALREAMDKAQIAHKEGLQMVKSLAQEDAHLKGAILHRMGKAYAALKRYSEAIDCFQRADQCLREVDVATPVERAIVLDDFEAICKLARQDEKAAEIRSTIQTALTEASTSTNISTLDDLADYYIGHGKLSEAKDVLDRTKTLLETGGEPTEREIVEIGMSYNALGRAYRRAGIHNEALASCQLAAELLEGRGDSQTYGVIMHDIGEIYQAQQQLDQAVIYYEKARAYKQDVRDLIVTLRTLADVYATLNQHEKSLEVCDDALEKLKMITQYIIAQRIVLCELHDTNVR